MTDSAKIVNQPRSSTVESKLRRQICKTGRSMYGSGLVVATEGNLSVRVDDDRILVTPTGVCKGHLIARDLLITDLNGTVRRGTGRPSSQIFLHLLYYHLRHAVYFIGQADAAIPT